MTSTEPETEDVPPNPGALIESMRAFGYSLPAAVADLVDNSLSAGATAISVRFTWAGTDSWFSVEDDGRGMDEQELRDAMRLGSKNPTAVRDPSDLGRFGLGLKSAAFSQGRSLTVRSRPVARASAEAAVRRWDLDHVEETQAWSLLTSPTRQGEAVLAAQPADVSTVVLVERLDRLVGGEETDDRKAHHRYNDQIRKVEDHLRMVFHRFLSGKGRVTLRVNDTEVTAWDPFLGDHPATQQLPGDQYDNGKVRIQPFVLPHASKLTDEQHRQAAGPKGWNAQQGFYVYRARRLLVAGEWLGLPRMQQEEHYKLARIRVDLDNDLDEEWQIDVRKATARPPGRLREPLGGIAKATRQRAVEVYRFRGKTTARSTRSKSIDFVWERVATRDGHRYRINRDHPVIRGALDELDGRRALGDRLLRLAEENIPTAAIVVDAREAPATAEMTKPFSGGGNEVSAMLRDAFRAMVGQGVGPADALAALASVEPFNFHPELVGVLREEENL